MNQKLLLTLVAALALVPRKRAVATLCTKVHI